MNNDEIKKIAKKYREKMKNVEYINANVPVVNNSIEEMAELNQLINSAIRYTTFNTDKVKIKQVYFNKTDNKRRIKKYGTVRPYNFIDLSKPVFNWNNCVKVKMGDDIIMCHVDNIETIWEFPYPTLKISLLGPYHK